MKTGKKFAASYSGGKDSILAIHRAIAQGYEPVGLLTTYDEQNGHSWFHNIPESVLRQAADAMGVPLTIIKTGGDQYALDFEKALGDFKTMGAELCVFGDIDIEEHFDWCDTRCRNAGLESCFPLWQERREDLVSEFIQNGFKAVITVLDTTRMDQKYLGQTLSEELICRIASDGTDVCGENGEYHTIVYDGPVFKSPLKLFFGDIARASNYIRLPILYAKVQPFRCGRRLRRGVTTGSCAAAAAKAAATLLLSGQAADNVSLYAKDGTSLTFDVAIEEYAYGDYASCSVMKDAGDDPDVTDGIKIVASVSKIKSGIEIDGGEGVGRVTRAGLKIPVGQAAINPVPLEMIQKEVVSVAKDHQYAEGLRIVISVPDGEEIAKRTMNGRLGITDGISILGTTGIVEPMSEKAIIDTIKTEIDVHMAEGRGSLLVTPGNYGRDFAKDELGLNIDEAIKCSNFIGDTLDYAIFSGVKQITLIGHAGKLVKLAGGIMNTHSSVADCRMEIIAAHCAMAGASAGIVREIMGCITVDAAIDIIQKEALDDEMWDSIHQRIGFHIRERTKGCLQVRYIIFTQKYGVLIDQVT